MSFLDRFNRKQEINTSWKNLTDISTLDQIVEDSKSKPVVLFKHSTTCGISNGAKHKLEADWDLDTAEMDMYYLDLLTYRPISNAIAERFDVIHQSPQIIVIKNGKAVFNTSHHAIDVAGIRKAL